MLTRLPLLVLTLLSTAAGQSTSDRPRYKFLDAKYENHVVTGINETVASGYRLLLPTPVPLFELSTPAASHEFKEVKAGANSVKFVEALNTAAADGFRYIPYSPLVQKDSLGAKYEYARAPHGWNGPTKPADLVKMAAQGYAPVGVVVFSNLLVSPYYELVLERPVGTAHAELSRTLPTYEIVDAMRADNVLKHVNELAAQGYRFLCPTGSQKGGGIAVLLEKCGPACGGPYDYKYFDAHDPSQVERDLNDMGKQGYRVVPTALYLRPHLLERDSTKPQTYAYRVLVAKGASAMETELNAAGKDGWAPVGYVFHFGFPNSAIYLIVERTSDTK